MQHLSRAVLLTSHLLLPVVESVLNCCDGIETEPILRLHIHAGSAVWTTGQLEKVQYQLQVKAQKLLNSLRGSAQLDAASSFQLEYQIYDYLCGTDLTHHSKMIELTRHYPAHLEERCNVIVAARQCAACAKLRVGDLEAANELLNESANLLKKLASSIPHGKLAKRRFSLDLLRGKLYYLKGVKYYSKAESHIRDALVQSLVPDFPPDDSALVLAYYLLGEIAFSKNDIYLCFSMFDAARHRLLSAGNLFHCMFDSHVVRSRMAAFPNL